MNMFKKVLLVTVLSLATVAAHAAAAFVKIGSTTNTAAATISSVTAGNALVYAISIYHGVSPSVASVSDPTNGSYTLLKRCVQASSFVDTEFWIKTNVSAGSFTVTAVPTNGSGNDYASAVYEISGLDNSTPLRDSGCANATNTATDGSVTTDSTTAQVGDMVLGAIAVGLSGSTDVHFGTNATTGYTNGRQYANFTAHTTISTDYKVAGTSGAQSAAWSHDATTGAGNGWAANIVVLAQSGGGGSAPTFTSGPTLGTQTSTTLPTTFTVDSTGTVYGVACPDGQTAPTVSQVKAGNCTGDVAAASAWTEAVTATVSDGHTFTGLSASTTYDLSFVANHSTNGDSSRAAINDATTTSSGYSCPGGSVQCITLASVSGTSWCADLNAIPISPTIATGDIVEVPTTTTPGGFAITQSTDCNLSYSGTSARQSMQYSVWDTSASGYMSGSPATYYFNNQAPVAISPTLDLILPIGAAFSTDLCAQFTDAEGDTLTGSNSSTGTGTGANKHPAATSFGSTGNCTWSGTPTTAASGSFTFTGTDVAGATASFTINWTVIAATSTVPNVVGSTLEQALFSLDSVYLLGQISSLTCDPVVPAGSIKSQSPAAASTANVFSTVSLDVSSGLCNSHGTVIQKLKARGGMRIRGAQLRTPYPFRRAA